MLRVWWRISASSQELPLHFDLRTRSTLYDYLLLLPLFWVNLIIPVMNTRDVCIQELNSYFAFLFEMISARAPLMGFNVSLNRYDLFHGHLFLASDTGRLGILWVKRLQGCLQFSNKISCDLTTLCLLINPFCRFHAKEYPAYDKKVFPYHMGYCQKGYIFHLYYNVVDSSVYLSFNYSW